MRTLGKYELLEEIGRGGFATVYKARDIDLDRIVALKVLHPHWTADPAFAARFRREAKAAARLRHPYIVTVYDAGETEGQLYIAMEYLQGRTLQGILDAEGQFSLEQALPILVQVAEALDYAHGEGLVHRDVKPVNIIVEGSDRGLRAVLTDFGLVKALAASSVLTSQGMLLGSPEYMAPEQADPEHALEVGPAADLYALGIIAYQMLTGRVPFPGNTPATLNAHENRPVPPPRDLCPELSEPVAAALLKMLAKAPEERFALAGDFVTSLRAAYLEQRQRVQVQALYEQVQIAEEASHWEDVLKLGGQILVLQPNDRDLQRRMAHAQSQLSGSPAKKLAWGWILGGIAALTLLIVGLSRDRGKQPMIPTLSPTAFPEKTASLLTSTPTSIPTLAPGDTQTRASDGMVMVYVPAGRFVMGSAEGDADEQPRHEVTLTGAWMDRTEVTNAQFAAFLTDQGNRITEGTPWLDLTHDACRIVAEGGEAGVDVVYRPEEGFASYPVVAVSWYGAAAYCGWIGGRLPTEAEWEYAARGATGLAYPWGQAFECALCNAADETCDGYAEAAPVGNFPEGASWCGTVDLAGNVWEWVADWYDATYYQRSEFRDPPGPEEGTSRVVRGGSWRSDAKGVRGSSRFWHAPSYVEDSLGFRCVMPFSQEP